METYQRFLLASTVVPGVLLAVRFRASITRVRLWALLIMMFMVYSQTPFWDHHAIKQGFYAYDPERIWGLHVGLIPLEQFILYGTHTVCVALMMWAMLDRRARRASTERPHA
jgi:lycopene cyclase domain-containing protein